MNNFDMMKKRLQFQGGIAQEDRMIEGKRRTFQKTLQYSYQACNVRKIQPYDECIQDNGILYPMYRALINPDKIKQDYDDKILSIDYSTGFQLGDIFEQIPDGQEHQERSNWIIYLQELTEDAYFRGEIRRCRYQIKFKDENGDIFSTWAAIRGPVETQIDSIQKNQIRVDRPNLSLSILLPRNEKTLLAFDRYKEFIFDGRCWRVEAPDFISMKNIIEINAEEYFIDRDTDNDLKNGLVVETIDPTPDTEILGETFIMPKITEVYTAPDKGGKWCVIEDNMPVTITQRDLFQIDVTWNKTTSGRFTLQWSKGSKTITKVIVVDSLL